MKKEESIESIEKDGKGFIEKNKSKLNSKPAPKIEPVLEDKLKKNLSDFAKNN